MYFEKIVNWGREGMVSNHEVGGQITPRVWHHREMKSNTASCVLCKHSRPKVQLNDFAQIKWFCLDFASPLLLTKVEIHRDLFLS